MACRRPRPTSSPARARRSSSSSSARRFSIPATACWSSARTSPRTCRTSRGAARGRGCADLQQENEFRPDLSDVERFLQRATRGPRRSSSTARTIRPAAWPPRTTCAAWPTSSAAATWPSSATSRTTTWSGAAGITRSLAAAGHARPVRGGLHVQQVVQHERLAAGLRRQQPGDRRDARQDDQHVALVRAAAGAAGRRGGPARRRRRARPHDAALPREGRAAGRAA